MIPGWWPSCHSYRIGANVAMLDVWEPGHVHIPWMFPLCIPFRFYEQTLALICFDGRCWTWICLKRLIKPRELTGQTSTGTSTLHRSRSLRLRVSWSKVAYDSIFSKQGSPAARWSSWWMFCEWWVAMVSMEQWSKTRWHLNHSATWRNDLGWWLGDAWSSRVQNHPVTCST